MDFRFGKKLSGERTFTICGMAYSLAPEIVQGKGHGLPADWYALRKPLRLHCNSLRYSSFTMVCVYYKKQNVIEIYMLIAQFDSWLIVRSSTIVIYILNACFGNQLSNC